MMRLNFLCGLLGTMLLLCTEVFADTTWWHPEVKTTWQIQLQGKINRTSAINMYVLDLFDTSAATIKLLHARGSKVVCYLNAGSLEQWRADSEDFPAELIGLPLSDWLGENWLDISQLETLIPLLTARLDLAQSKACDGLDFDNVDGFTHDTGFVLTEADQANFNHWLAIAAHERGMAAGLRNDATQALDLSAYFDFALSEACQIKQECELYEAFSYANKPVFDIEYRGTPTKICANAKRFGINTLIKQSQLTAWRYACR